MAATLPYNRQLKLAQVLAQWPHWHCDPRLTEAPGLDATLEPGFSNTSFRVSHRDGRAFVVRLDGVEAVNHGINRQIEWHALHLAHRAGLAPRPCYFNPELGATVCAYLPPDEDQRDRPADIATLLRRIHALPAVHYRLDLGERIARYQHQCARLSSSHLRQLAPFETLVARLLDWQRHSNPEPVLCHNDLLAANRLYSGGRLWALDWEYCAMGSRWFDLAVVCCDDGWREEDREALLQAYLQRPPKPAERRDLARYSVLYRYIELLWFASVSPDTTDWQGKLAGLEGAAARDQSGGYAAE